MFLSFCSFTFFLILVSFHSSRNNNVLFCLLSEYCMDSGFLYYVCGQKKRESQWQSSSVLSVFCLCSVCVFVCLFGLHVIIIIKFFSNYIPGCTKILLSFFSSGMLISPLAFLLYTKKNFSFHYLSLLEN